MAEDHPTRTLANLPLGTQPEDCTLEVVEGADRGQRYPLTTEPLLIGTAGECDVPLVDPTVSSRHARLTVEPDGFRLDDLDSKNGTFYLGSRIDSLLLPPGASFTVGRTQMTITVTEAGELPPSAATSHGDLIGRSVAWRRVFGVLERLEKTEISVLLDGETGVGKSAVAQAIHQRSARRDREMIVVDCGATSGALIQSELFGHARGAFTGADRSHEGMVAAAEGSTLFLEEVGELPLDLQPVLLRLLEAREYTRVGETKTRTADVRVVAATNRDLVAAVARKTFRYDLYYRLAVVTITVPPLRQCREDIVPLAERFLAERGAAQELTGAQRALLESYRWPGNIRQLRNAVARFTAMGSFFDRQPDQRIASTREGDFKALKAEAIRQFERDYLTSLLAGCEGNLSAAARESGVARNYLRKLTRQHGIDLDSYRRRMSPEG